jgi:hypothetical protein
MPDTGGTGGVGGAGGDPGGLGGAGGRGGDFVTRPVGWERLAPWIVSLAFVITVAMVAYCAYTLHQHNADLTCLVNSNKVVAADLHHAIAHDNNPADYKLIVTC